MSKWTNDKKFYKCSDSRTSRNAWDASVELGKGNTPWNINLMFEEITKKTKKLPRSRDSNQLPIESKQNDNNLRTLYRRDHDRRKTTKNQCEDLTNLREDQQRDPVQCTPSKDATTTTHNERASLEQTTASKLNTSKQRLFLKQIRSNHSNKAPFLYEHYPLRPALLYGSPSSFICDPLKRLKQIPYLPENPDLKFISSALSICQDALVNPELMSTTVIPTNIKQAGLKCDDNLEQIQNATHVMSMKKPTESVGTSRQHARLKSGSEGEYRRANTPIGRSAMQTRRAYAAKGESVEDACPTCHRNAFLVPRDLQYDMELTIAFDDAIKMENSENTTKAQKEYKDEAKLKKSAERKEYDYRVRLKQVRDTDEKQLPSPQPTASGDSLAPDYNASVPIFEVLNRNDYKCYANQPSLKQKDSLLLYEDLKRNRKRKRKDKSYPTKTLEPRDGKLCGFVRFFDEVRLDYNPSDEDIVYRGAKGLRGKSQSWERSRIEWLAELERCQEVRRRRQRRLAYQKCEQNASRSYLGKCTFLCQRIRMWLGKWTR